jgi:hydroxypyruvate isomerase
VSTFKQSILWWCYEDFDLEPETLMRAIVEAGYSGVEIFQENLFPLVKSYGLEIVAIQGHVPLEDGLNKRENADRIEKQIRERIELAAQWGVPNLICFSGNRDGLDDATGAAVTAETLQRVVPIAEDAGVTLVLETLNSKVDHPDYMADSTRWAVDVVKQVDSPAVKVLYDIYHMQVMEGDIIATIRKYHPYIGHYHTAGCPGRNEIGESQEIYYPAVMRAITETGFTGYVGQEFIPLGDPIAAIAEAYRICDVAD